MLCTEHKTLLTICNCDLIDYEDYIVKRKIPKKIIEDDLTETEDDEINKQK